VLGLWIEQSEGTKFWLKVINELKARGVNADLSAKRGADNYHRVSEKVPDLGASKERE
jgi:transposase-like protein